MTVKELLAELEIIHRERTLAAHHDGMFLKTYSDVEALERVIDLVEFLNEQSPDSKVTVAELLAVCKVKQT